MAIEAYLDEMVAVLSDQELEQLQAREPGLTPAYRHHVDQCIKFYLSNAECDKEVRSMLAQLRFEQGILVMAERDRCNAVYYRRKPFYLDNGTDVEACAFVECYRLSR